MVPGKPKEYEKVFRLDKDITIKIKLNKPVRDVTLVIGKIVRVQAGDQTVVYETGFLEKKRRKIRRKLFFRKIRKSLFSLWNKIFRSVRK